MNTSSTQSAVRKYARALLFVLINCWLVYHLAAIVIAPATVLPSSSLEQSAWQLFQPYLQALYLNHGYRFFAPQPTESTLLAYVVERKDGSQVSGRIPNFDIHPRLLYHRHFMLTEFYGFLPPDLEPTWNRSYARHLCHRYRAERVSLSRLKHYPASTEMVVKGTKLEDSASYEEQPLGTFRWDEL